MRLFLIRTVCFLLGLLAIAWVTDFAVTSGLRKTNYNEFEGWSDIYHGRINADVVFLGSSRAMVHFSTSILDSALNTNTYNLGFSGGRYQDWKTKFDVYLEKNKTPQHLIVALDLFSFEQKGGIVDPVQLYPYVRNDKIKALLKDEGNMDFFQLEFPLVRYIGSSNVAAVGIQEFLKLKHYKGKKIKGYLPRNVGWDGNFDNLKKKYPHGYWQKFDKATFREFIAFIKELQMKGIQISFVYPPELKEGQGYVINRDSIMSAYDSLAKAFQIPFLDYSMDSLCNQKPLFYNSTHMNKNGATIFSKKFSRDLAWITRDSL